MDKPAFWENPEQVERFADRDPDHRLMKLVGDYPRPASTPVLDIGCAGGRNTVVLAQRGFDFHALDASAAMIERTRQRVSAIIGADEAARRIRVGRMEELGAFDDGWFDLVISLGVLHSAETVEQWNRAVDEVARVLAPGGRWLVSNFAPGSQPHGVPLVRVGEKPVYEGFEPGRMVLFEADRVDREVTRRGLRAAVPTDTVVADRPEGYVVVVNALYARPGP